MRNILIIFGFTGDLSKRKLIPALDKIIRENYIQPTEFIGISRRETNVQEVLKTSLGEKYNSSPLKLSSKSYILDEDLEQYINFKHELNLEEDDNVVIYFSIPPEQINKYVEKLGLAAFNSKNIKLVFEKPFGSSLDNAKKCFELVNTYFNEQNIYHVDHYLLKNILQKINFFIINNKHLSDKMSNEFVKEINVYGLEQIDIQGRSYFYEQTGCLVDFIQSHLIETLALFLCKNTTSENYYNERIEQVEKIIPITNFSECAIRGQYKGYKQEVSNPESKVETFAAVKLQSAHKNWTSVVFNLISAKANSSKESYVEIKFLNGENIKFSISPSEELPASFDGTTLVDNSESKIPDAYEGIFTAVFREIKQLFVSKKEILHSWEVFQALLDYWKLFSDGIKTYEKYSDVLKLIKN